MTGRLILVFCFLALFCTPIFADNTDLGGAPNQNSTTQQYTGFGSAVAKAIDTAEGVGGFLISIIANFVPVFFALCPAIGFWLIGKAIILLMQGNQGPNQGKGAVSKLILGVCFTAMPIVINVLLILFISSGFTQLCAVAKVLKSAQSVVSGACAK